MVLLLYAIIFCLPSLVLALHFNENVSTLVSMVFHYITVYFEANATAPPLSSCTLYVWFYSGAYWKPGLLLSICVHLSPGSC